MSKPEFGETYYRVPKPTKKFFKALNRHTFLNLELTLAQLSQWAFLKLGKLSKCFEKLGMNFTPNLQKVKKKLQPIEKDLMKLKPS